MTILKNGKTFVDWYEDITVSVIDARVTDQTNTTTIEESPVMVIGRVNIPTTNTNTTSVRALPLRAVLMDQSGVDFVPNNESISAKWLWPSNPSTIALNTHLYHGDNHHTNVTLSEDTRVVDVAVRIHRKHFRQALQREYARFREYLQEMETGHTLDNEHETIKKEKTRTHTKTLKLNDTRYTSKPITESADELMYHLCNVLFNDSGR